MSELIKSVLEREISEFYLKDRIPLFYCFPFLSHRDDIKGKSQVEPLYSSYLINLYVLALVFEAGGFWLRHHNYELYKQLKNTLFLEHPSGYVLINPEAKEEDFQKAADQKIFSQMRVLCVAGVEGRLFADLGAVVTNIDPRIVELNSQFLVKNPNLTEIATPFSSEIAARWRKEGNIFDISFSCRFFEKGSGLYDDSSYYYTSPDQYEFLIYQRLLEDLISVTDTGGKTIHDGDMVSEIIGDRKYRRFKIDKESFENSDVWVIDT